MRSLSAKRALDLAGSLLLLLLLAPVLATAYAAVALTSPGGAFLRQPRAGLRGEPFLMLRFRADPRTDPVGRLLRRLSLDGLPQLINVVRGEMSLVGPRPLPVQDSGRTSPTHGRLAVLPGMTGLWQVSSRSELPWDEMVLLDLEYVDTHCLAVDLGILARTVPAVLTAHRARPAVEGARAQAVQGSGA
ncbi:sugar transferase [Streptomyces sp. NPDC021093]|uniref:sugar transferase n=1 Tax=Streptomyces sp. NPDC021093 TaxID=3365112 RepID=UPI0037B3ADA6